MTARRDVGELLAGQLEAIEADLLARAKPFAEAAEMRTQRDSARRWAVDYEQTAAEYMRRVNIAAAFVADMECDTERHAAPIRGECERCYLERVLAGDE